MPNATKIERVAELKEQIERANALLLTEYRGLTVEEITELRRSLRDVDASLAVIKNTLMTRAANDAGIAELDELLSGPSAVAFVNGDVVAVAKKLKDASKQFPSLVIKGGLHGRRAAGRGGRHGSCRPREPRGDAVQDRRDAEVRDVPRRGDVIATQSKFLSLLEAYKEKLPAEASTERAGRGSRRRGAGRDGSARRAGGERRERREHRRSTSRRERSTERGGVTMAKVKTEDLLESFKEMTLLELSDFIKQFEETFDVTAAAAAPVMMAAPGGPAAAARLPRSRPSSTWSSPPSATRRSTSSRRSARSRASASRRPRISSRARRRRSWRRSRRTWPTTRRARSRTRGRPSRSSKPGLRASETRGQGAFGSWRGSVAADVRRRSFVHHDPGARLRA